MGWIPTSERSNEPGEPKRPAKAFAGVEGIPAGGATPERGQARPLLPRMPSDFYRGRARARRAAFVAFVLVIGSLAFMAEAHLMDLGAPFGLLVAKVINSAGFGSVQAVADGIRFCLDPFGDGTRGADIISISLGTSAPQLGGTGVSLAAQQALDRGVFVVAAAGNDGGPFDDGDVEVPADASFAIAVGAVDASRRIAPFSSIGSGANRTDPNLKPEVTAPRVQIISAAPRAHYVTSTGTSPATAITAGIVALLLEAHPELLPAGSTANILALKWALARSAATARGQVTPHDPWYGYGVIDGRRALGYL